MNRNRGFATGDAAAMVFQHYGLAKTQSQLRDSKVPSSSYGASVMDGKNNIRANFFLEWRK
jgi:hypothetical protein